MPLAAASITIGALRVSWDVLELHIPRRDKIRAWSPGAPSYSNILAPYFFARTC
jgi:hypothetical protein